MEVGLTDETIATEAPNFARTLRNLSPEKSAEFGRETAERLGEAVLGNLRDAMSGKISYDVAVDSSQEAFRKAISANDATKEENAGCSSKFFLYRRKFDSRAGNVGIGEDAFFDALATHENAFSKALANLAMTAMESSDPFRVAKNGRSESAWTFYGLRSRREDAAKEAFESLVKVGVGHGYPEGECLLRYSEQFYGSSRGPTKVPYVFHPYIAAADHSESTPHRRFVRILGEAERLSGRKADDSVMKSKAFALFLRTDEGVAVSKLPGIDEETVASYFAGFLNLGREDDGPVPPAVRA